MQHEHSSSFSHVKLGSIPICFPHLNGIIKPLNSMNVVCDTNLVWYRFNPSFCWWKIFPKWNTTRTQHKCKVPDQFIIWICSNYCWTVSMYHPCVSMSTGAESICKLKIFYQIDIWRVHGNQCSSMNNMIITRFTSHSANNGKCVEVRVDQFQNRNWYLVSLMIILIFYAWQISCLSWRK